LSKLAVLGKKKLKTHGVQLTQYFWCKSKNL